MKTSAIGDAWRRLKRRDAWPRAWWYPQPRAKAAGADEALWRTRHEQLSDKIRYTLLALLGFSFFCVLTLGAPDSTLLTGAGKIPVPFANTEINFTTFIAVGPLVVIAHAIYLHILLGQVLELPAVRELELTPTVFNLPGRVPRLLSYLAFYWLAPVVLVVFAQRAAPSEAGTQLVLVAALFILVLLLLQLRRNAVGSGHGQRVVLWILLALIVAVPVRIMRWQMSGGERPFARRWQLQGADLSKINLISVDLEGADFRRAKLKETNLTRARLQGANFANADLSGASLREADLRDATLSGASLRKTDFQLANLRYAVVHETDLRSAEIGDEQLRGLCFDSSTIFAAQRKPPTLAPKCLGGGEQRVRLCQVHPPEREASCDLSLIDKIVAPASGYVAACLQSCSPYYVDRGDSHTLDKIPAELESGTWIKTTNTGDKSEQATDFLRFEITQPSWVYVGYDSRMARAPRRPPDWLIGQFERTALILDVNEPDPRQEFSLYRKLFAAGCVTLGGNFAHGADFRGADGSNYIVVVKPVNATATGMPLQSATPAHCVP